MIPYTGDPNTAFVPRVISKPRSLARSDLRHGKGVKSMVGLELPGMARAALRRAVKQHHPALFHVRQLTLPRHISVKQTVIGAPFGADEISEDIANLGKTDRRAFAQDHIKALSIFRDRFHPRRNSVQRPAGLRQLTKPHRLRHLVFGLMPCHLIRREHREHGLRGKSIIEPLHHILAQRCADTAGKTRMILKSAIMKHHPKLCDAKIPQRGRIARQALFGQVFGICAAIGAKTYAAFPKAQRHPIRGAKARVVASGTGDIAVARQDGVVEQQLTQLDRLHIRGGKRRTRTKVRSIAGTCPSCGGQGKANSDHPFHVWSNSNRRVWR